MMPSLSIHILSLALCLSSGFQQGYIASVLNQPYLQMQRFINDSWLVRTGSPMKLSTLDMMWSFLNVCFPIAMIFGQFLAAIMCKKIGRRGTALVATAVYVPATLLSAGAKMCHSFELLYVGRILWSLANGVSSVNATVWIVECAPPQIRGRMAAMQEFFMAAGALVTQALGVPFASDTLWPWIFVPNLVFVLASFIMFIFLYESPQYLMQKGEEDKARKALAAYHGVDVDDSSLDAELRICEEALEKKDAKQKEKGVGSVTEYDSLTILFMPWKARDPVSQVVRYGAWLGVMVKIAYVFTGARCLRSYSTFVLYSMGGWSHSAALMESLIIGILRLPTTLIPVFLVDRIGRRPMLIGSTAVCFFSLILMVVGINVGPSFKVATLIGLTTLLLISACGIGSLSRFYSAELVPRNILLSSVSILTMFEALTKIGVEFAFYPLANVIYAQSLLMFLVPTGIFTIMMWYCPETSRRSVNEVLNEMAQQKKIDVSFLT
ncbi:unnamed protein product [Cylicocyclus nassatus]|uniref:Major facilitator superfamily (MFS) profile domain-containing protein n=1 Tax=Cylicocyclus nassatus TaxID=53992 RepID=A0AA36MEF5_CYLNA|nr:unnamed protein product [Cylicocyclus nassatus]